MEKMLEKAKLQQRKQDEQ